MSRIDNRRIIRGVALQLLYELDNTTHKPAEVLQLFGSLDLNDPSGRMLGFIGLRVHHKQEIPAKPPERRVVALDKPMQQRSAIDQVVIDYLTVDLPSEPNLTNLTAEIEYQLIVEDVEEFDFQFRPSEDLLDAGEMQTLHQMVMTVYQRRQDIDRVVQQYAPDWTIEQMTTIDRNILRIAVFEMTMISTITPVRVAINEAVEIAKIFGAESSARFVNGILGAIAQNTKAIAQHFAEHPISTTEEGS